ncbi:non-hydrolyzing UDP-N-acetylglucosamine 2-epimerase [Dyella subtropica]|uniref:non-hydrolyzing UDP-N-acetylglucosamine 2-epimerase n=1 Tax=Dyella subtropica TaxID=2992127 RepID=UPI00224E190C|nr:UDP-N-acetylglucosamine 2-epimerase (non-hydrolyzing) [Dyella subtropica]
MQDILIISGTRPEIIKLAPLYHCLRASRWARPQWLHTGQHDEMARQMLGCFDIAPDISLERGGNGLCEFSTRCRSLLDQVLSKGTWSLVIVQGDTESTFLGALGGFYHHVMVAHVEAGLRTHDLEQPFPEEGLRQMVSRIASFHFAPTPRAAMALRAESIPQERIFVTGNTVIDAQHWVTRRYQIQRKVKGLGHLLVTAHRRESWGSDLREICYAIADVASRHPELQVLFPVHLNPVVSQPVHAILGELPNVHLSAPFDYLAMQQALVDSWLVLTDSGGLQEEAPTFGVPLLVLRTATERPEAIEAGCARLAGTRRASIVKQIEELWSNPNAYLSMARADNPFGDGRASIRIADLLQNALACSEGQRVAS